MGFIAKMLFGAGILLCYFLPTIIAYKRGAKNREPISWLNVLTGWTGLGWLVTIVWALTDKEEK